MVLESREVLVLESREVLVCINYYQGDKNEMSQIIVILRVLSDRLVLRSSIITTLLHLTDGHGKIKYVALMSGAFCFFLSLIFDAVSQESYIEIYEHPNYGGGIYVLNESQVSLSEFNDIGFSFKVSIFNKLNMICLKLNKCSVIKTEIIIYLYISVFICSCVWAQLLPSASEGWVKVMFSVCLSVHTSRGGYPGQVWMVGGGVPWPGLDGGGVTQPGLDGGVPGVPPLPPGQVWMVGAGVPEDSDRRSLR